MSFADWLDSLRRNAVEFVTQRASSRARGKARRAGRLSSAERPNLVECLEQRFMLSAAVFGAQQTFSTGFGPSSITMADVNGDGKPDLIVANSNGNSVSVLLGNGDGTFQAQATFAAGTNPFALATADVNGDGNVDLVVADYATSRVSVLLGNGNGTFGAPAPFFVGTGPRSVAVADVNGDHHPDLLVANEISTSVSVLLGNGNGTFQNQATFATGFFPRSIAAADVDGDGNVDLLVANEGGNSVSVLLGNGDGTFQAQATFAAGSNPQSVASADVNGDGKVDLLVANYASASVSVLLGNGNGTFGAQQTFATGSHPTSVAVADLNGDAKPDLLAANYSNNSVSVLLGNGNGTFQTQATFATGTGPRFAASADVNGDGAPDLFVPNLPDGTVSVLLGDPPPFAQSIRRTTPSGAIDGASSVTYTVTFSKPVTGVDATDFALALSGVTTTPPLVVAGSGAVYTVTVNGIAGTGTLGLNLVDDGTIHDSLGNPLGLQALTSIAAGAGPQLVAVADVNGDGIPDLIVGHYSINDVSVLLGNGDGTFQAQQTFAAGDGPASVVVTDVNGDGIPDLVVANYRSNNVSVLLGNGNGTFQPQQSLAVGSAPYSVAVADVNGDGIPDLITANFASQSVSVLLGNGNGTFQAQATFAIGTNPNAIAVADVNGDKIPDLIVSDAAGATVRVLLGNGNGTFTAPHSFATAGRSLSVAVADVNGDNKPDLILAIQLGNSVSVLLGNGNGTFQPQQTLAVGADPVVVSAGDVNGDGKLDLVVTNFNDGTVSLLAGNGNGTFQAQATFASGPRPNAAVVADVNGDGKADIVVPNGTAGTVSVLHPDQSTSLTGQTYVVDMPSVNPAALSLSAAPPASLVGSAVVLTATVGSPTINGPTPTGMVTFFDGATSIGTAALTANGTATLTTLTLSVGTHPMTVLYAGDSLYGANVATPVNVVVVSKKVNAVLNIASVTFPFDINPHPATATATGVAGEDLGSLLHLTYQNLADNTISASAPIQPGTYEVFASFDGNSTYLPVANFDTTRTIVIGSESSLQSAPSGKLPTATLVAGGKIKPIHLTIKLTNSLATLFTGNVTVNVTLSTSPTGATSDPIVGTISKKKLKIKGNKTVPFGTVTIKTLTNLTGTLFFIAKLTDSTGATNAIPFPGSITAAAPFIDLAALTVVPAPKVRRGKKLMATLTLIQNGNIPLAGNVTVELFLSLDGTMTSAIDLGLTAGHVPPQPGKKGVLHLTATIPSSVPANTYHVIAKIDPHNVFSDTNLGNNVVSSLKTVIVS